LRQAFLREAMQGKLCHAELVSASEETGHELLAKINAEKTNLIKAKKLKAGLASSQTISLVNDIKIPSHWVWCKADEIFFITKLAGFEYSKHIKLSEHGEIPVIRAQNVRALNIDKKNLLYIDRQTSELLERCALTKKSLLVTFIGAGIGDVATFEEKERWHLAPNVAKMEPFIGCENLLSVKFINYFMMSDLGQKEIFKHVKATAQPSLSMGTIRDIDIPLPPLYEQEQIVAKLEELMAFCDGLEQSIKESQGYNEQLLQQVLREALSGEVKNK
jgi:type I restriction enzyme S subunit